MLGRLEMFVVGVVAGMLTFMLLSLVLGQSPSQVKEQIRQQAVEHGHAEWVVTGPDGQTEFRWKDSQDGE